MKKALLFGGLAVLTAAVAATIPASAETLGSGTVVTANGGFQSIDYGNGVAMFDDLTANAPATQGAFSDSGYNFSQGVVANNSSSGNYAQPAGDTSNYFAVLQNFSPVTITFAPSTTLGLYWGSIDTYNSIEFLNGSTVVDTVTGSDAAGAVPATASGQQTGSANNQFITISDLLGSNAVFNEVILTSTQNAFRLTIFRLV